MDTTDVLPFPTGYESKAHDFYELLNSPALLSYTTPTADLDYDDSTLKGMLYRAHRAQVDHSVREDLSVSLSSSVSERTGRPVEERAGRLVVASGQELDVANAQIRTLLDRQKEQILAECQAEIKKHEFQADYDRRSVRTLGEIIESQQEELHCAEADEINNFFMKGY